ncbi:LysR family transcriptional regulator [Chryseobacterium arthrosphaerae]|uniref:LysR family transcriptional regulator n=1 Tax=Chryseobacterium arthrosphaerae TaxID=651561 RepID=A0ABU7QXF3_9FLAO|nr:LysR family transcriptional regulator [Chryseobacterium arthrosphaerae]UEQ76351.1 LysR family transcriptional regulator [Chryseobacterium arthrosphaerae]
MSYQIELRHLKYFQVLSNELSFRKASEKLFISQPGLSRQIKQMEEIFNVTLFNRTKKKVELSEAGLYLKKEVDFIFNHLINIKEQLENISQGRQSELRIGFLGSAAEKIIPDCVVKLNRIYPEIRTVLQEMPNKLQVKLLEEHQLDIGFVRLQNIPEGISKHLIHQDSFSLVLPKNHPIDNIDDETFKSLYKESFIFFSSEDSPHYFDVIMSICEDHGFRPKVFHKSINALTIYKLVEEGLGIAILPTSLQYGYDLNVKFLELNYIPQKTELYMVWKESNRNPILKDIINYLTEN